MTRISVIGNAVLKFSLTEEPRARIWYAHARPLPRKGVSAAYIRFFLTGGAPYTGGPGFSWSRTPRPRSNQYISGPLHSLYLSMLLENTS